MSTLASLAVSFFATMGFALLFHLRPALLVPACLGGMLSWGVYLFCVTCMDGVFFPCLVASLFAAAYSMALSSKTKVPLAVLYILAEVPLIPGSGLFNTMKSVVLSDWASAATYAQTTAQFALAIALSIAVFAVAMGVVNAVRAKLPRRGSRGRGLRD